MHVPFPVVNEFEICYWATTQEFLKHISCKLQLVQFKPNVHEAASLFSGTLTLERTGT